MFAKYVLFKMVVFSCLRKEGYSLFEALKIVSSNNYKDFKVEHHKKEVISEQKRELIHYWKEDNNSAENAIKETEPCFMFPVALPFDDIEKMINLNEIERLISIVATKKFPCALLVFKNENDAKGGKNILNYYGWEILGNVEKHLISKEIVEAGLKRIQANIKPYDANNFRLQ